MEPQRQSEAANESSGATYSPARASAKCPQCGAWAKRSTTLPWDFDLGIRIRHHKCAECGRSFKSTEDDPTLQ